MRRARRARRAFLGRTLTVLASSLVLAVGVMGCTGGDRAPRTLTDGTPAKRLTVELDGVQRPVIVASLQTAPLHRRSRTLRATTCLGEGWGESPKGLLVHRVGTAGESVTFSGAARRTVHACDGVGTPSGAWCGHAFGRLKAGVLQDPRLDLGGCRTPEGQAVAFAWIDPDPDARYVVVRRRGFWEAYETAADLPVRVAVTEHLDLVRSRARLELSEHAADGRRLRAYEVEAFVAG